MHSDRDLASAAGIPFTLRHNMVLFVLADAKRFVRVAQQDRLIILGFDGFFLRGPDIIPDLGLIPDFSQMCSETDAVDHSANSAIRVLDECGTPAHYFEFVLMHEDDPKRFG